MPDLLLRASMSGGLAVIVLWTVCRALPRLSPATRTVIWWCAAAKFVIALFWVVPVEVPLDSSHALTTDVGQPFRAALGAFVQQSDAPVPHALPEADAPGNPPETQRSREQAASTARATSAGASPARQSSLITPANIFVLVLSAWACGVVAAFGLASKRWWRLRQVVREADRGAIALRQMGDELAYRLGLPHAPEIRVSDDVDTPLVTGFWTAVIVLPRSRFVALSLDGQRMALCHELAHIRRGDLMLGLVPALAERLFFFHPLTLYAAREYALSREAACDELVIAALDAAPDDYARLLLDLGVHPGRTGWVAAGAPYSFSNLKRRLMMLGSPSTPSTLSRIAAVAALCASVAMLVPLQLVAGVQPDLPAQRADLFLESEDKADADHETAPTASATRRRPSAQRRASSQIDRPRFILLRDGSDDAIWHGSSSDHARAKRHQRGDEPLLWFTRDGNEYVVRDPDVIAQAEKIWEPVGELGGEMGQLGGKLGALGGRQGEFGARQGALGGEQGRLGVRQAELGLKQAALALKNLQELEEEEREEIEREQRELEAEMRELSKEMEKFAEQMREFEAPMRDLEREMRPISKELERLGKQMEELARRAEGDMEALIERALKESLAEKVR